MKVAQLFDVKGLATIVTGGASGLGLAYAEAMADNGARVTLLDFDAKVWLKPRRNCGPKAAMCAARRWTSPTARRCAR